MYTKTKAFDAKRLESLNIRTIWVVAVSPEVGSKDRMGVGTKSLEKDEGWQRWTWRCGKAASESKSFNGGHQDCHGRRHAHCKGWASTLPNVGSSVQRWALQYHSSAAVALWPWIEGGRKGGYQGSKLWQRLLYIRGLQFYTFFGISIGITRRLIDIGKKITFYFLQNVWKCTVFFAFGF